MNINEAKQTFSNFLSSHNSVLTVDDYEVQTYNNDAAIFSRQSNDRPNPPYMVRGDKVAPINFAYSTIEKVYDDLG